jgi:hypothetical protein
MKKKKFIVYSKFIYLLSNLNNIYIYIYIYTFLILKKLIPLLL